MCNTVCTVGSKPMKIEIRTDCKMCGGPLPNSRYRTYCSAKCRNKSQNSKFAEKHKAWAIKKRDELASIPSVDRVQCLICGRWYVQLGTHTVQRHDMTGREYREHFELEVKRGLVPEWYRKMKGDQALENGTVNNLKKGAEFRFHKGQEGLGTYKRSQETLERLSKLHTLRKTKK